MRVPAKYFCSGVAALGLTIASLAGETARASTEQGASFSPWSDGWSLGVHVGRAIRQSVRSGEAFLPYEWDFRDYYLASAGVRKDVARLSRHSRLLTEANLAWISGDEEYAEASLTPALTWETFPWDRAVDTTAAIGVGLSYSSRATDIDATGRRWMASMIFELDFQPAPWSAWSVYARLHHRSNAWGVFGGGSGSRGSNFPAIGVRYAF